MKKKSQARPRKQRVEAPRRLAEDAEHDRIETTLPGTPLVRLNKYLADHGVASRRKCDELIAEGKVSIDGEPATELGMRIDPEQHTVEINGFVLKPRGTRKRYYLLNKPSGVVCTNEPRETRPRAVDLITDPFKGRIYTVGRLDEESKGLILLTNDGEFANRIMHPRFNIDKTYMVRVNGKIDEDAVQKIREGVHLSEGRTSGARVVVTRRTVEGSTLLVTIHEGMNREIRRAFARVGFKVVELRRVRIGALTDRGLKPGRWREVLRGEIEALLANEPRNEDATERPRKSKAVRKHGYARYLMQNRERAVARRPERGPKRAPAGGARPRPKVGRKQR